MSLTLISALVALCFITTQSQSFYQLTMDDNNTNVALDVGDKVEVILDGRPTTGHIWQNFYLEGNAVLQDGEPYYVRNHSNPGSNGVYHFPYIANQVGDGRLRLTEGRSWEDAPIAVFYVSFQVSPATPSVKSN